MSAAVEGTLEAVPDVPGFDADGVAGEAGFDGSVAEGSAAFDGSVTEGSADGSAGFVGSAEGLADGSPEVEEFAAAALAASTLAVLILPTLITDVTATAITQSNAVTHWITVFFINYLPQFF